MVAPSTLLAIQFPVEPAITFGAPSAFWTMVKPGTAAAVPALRAGSYYIRLYAPGGQLLREFSFEVLNRQR